MIAELRAAFWCWRWHRATARRRRATARQVAAFQVERRARDRYLVLRPLAAKEKGCNA